MSSIVDILGGRAVGTVESVSASGITVLVDPASPQATALNAGAPSGFPRINGYLLVPNEGGATVGVITAVKIERKPYPKRKGVQDFGLVDLPFPARLLTLTPLGTLTVKTEPGSEDVFLVRRGVDVFPSVGDSALLPTPAQLAAIVQGETEDAARRIQIGTCPTAGGAAVYVDPDRLFGRHLAVLGNTGSGKSCTVAGLIRWSLGQARTAVLDGLSTEPTEPSVSRGEGKTSVSRLNARFIVLDPNGEYADTFRDLGARVFAVGAAADGAGGKGPRPLEVPAWLWNGEEWAAFTGAAPGIQRPLLLEALRRLRSGGVTPDAVDTRLRSCATRYRAQLTMAKQSGDHQAKGRCERVAAILSNAEMDFADLAQQVGDAGLRSQLDALTQTAAQAEASARSNRDKNTQKWWHNPFADRDVQGVIDCLDAILGALGCQDEACVVSEDQPSAFAVDELAGYVEALSVDAAGRDASQFVDSLRLRIDGLLRRESLACVAAPETPASDALAGWLSDYIGGDERSEGQVVVLDLSLIPSEVVHIVVAVIGRLTFEALQRYRRDNGKELPTVLVLEEAHTFVHKSLASDTAPAAGRVCCRTFERIAREGRKFGLGLVFASQRPSEVSPTVLSQCNTFVLHRIVNDRDQEYVRSLVPDGLGDMLRELPSLPSRRAILVGWAAPAPVAVEIRELAELERPHSPDPAFWEVWTGKEPRPVDWEAIAATWCDTAGVAHAGPQDEDAADEVADEGGPDDIPF